MTRYCRFCKGEILHPAPRQVYCSDQCKIAAAYFRKSKEARAKAGEHEAATTWARRYQLGLHRNVCRYCLRMTWDEQEKEYCSPGCKYLDQGG